MPSGILISFFSSRSDARQSLWELNKKGFRRTAVLHRLPGGEISTFDCFTWVRMTGLATCSLLLAALAALADFVGLDQLILSHDLPLHTLIAIGGATGLVIGLTWIRRSTFGIESWVLDSYVHTLMPDESALLLQAPIDAMKLPMDTLRDKSESLPSIFILHPGREKRESPRDLVAPLSDGEISRRARHQAIDHRQTVERRKKETLLRRLKSENLRFQNICADLTEACRLEQSASSVAEWIIDNEFLVARAVRDVLLNLPKSFYRELPVIGVHEYWSGLPCIYELAKELIFDHESRLSKEKIIRFIDSYQDINKLTTAELWAVPQMLRIALIENILDLATRVHNDMRERQLASFWANRFIVANRYDSAHIYAILTELDDRTPEPSAYFCSQLVSLLYDQDATLAPIEGWLERKLFKSANEINFIEQKRQAKDQLLIENALNSIRQLTQIDWRDIFEELSWVEKVLATDPDGTYSQMDFRTRDTYRQIIKRFAFQCGRSEDTAARVAVEIAARSRCHIGHVLLGRKKPLLEHALQCRDTFGQRCRAAIRRHHTSVYLGGLTPLFAAIFGMMLVYILPGRSPGVQLLMAVLLVIPTSQLAVELYNYLLTRALKPQALPKLDFEETRIPDEFRTLVVVPTLLVSEKSIRHEIENLEIRFMANRDENLRFGLFTDYTDSPNLRTDQDEMLLQIAVNGIIELNRRYETDTFYLFHRERSWSDSEQKYIGWERKRGKLEELNLLLAGTDPGSVDMLIHAGNPERLAGTCFLITLDSDTQLPHGTARRMIETLAHPLNRARFDDSGAIVEGTYTILQPRVTASLQSTGKSIFSQTYADAVGIDPYTRVVSDVYQDLTGEGSYHGKGIYDIMAFSKVLSGNFPDELILSHDLIEGAHVRTALATDIELFDDFPQDYLGYVTRMRRWIRGDWQIFAWIFPWVPKKGGGFRKNPISIFNRWKVFDNLRRSLLPATNLALLAAGWMISYRVAMAVMLLIGIQIFFNPFSQIATAVSTRKGLRNFALSIHINHLIRSLAEIALLPHQAWVTLSAIGQAWYRLLVSRRKLLEWTTAYGAQTTLARRRRRFTASLVLASAISVLIGTAQLRWMPGNLLIAAPWLILWFFSPFFGWLLTSRPKEKKLQELLPQKDILYLRRVCRLTWRFFADFVNSETAWLPPDNYQVSHQDQLAMRTSPTNIGFWLLSVLAARDGGYLTQDAAVATLEHSLATVQRLERFEGHLYNWYDIRDLAPLEPRYVSSVDSSNFLGALWTLQQGMIDQFNNEIIDKSLFSGLYDTGSLLFDLLKKDSGSMPAAKELEGLLAVIDQPPARIVDQLRLLRTCETTTANIKSLVQARAASGDEIVYWSLDLYQQVRHWRQTADRYLGWVELLGMKHGNEQDRAAIRNFSEIENDLTYAPSLQTLARGLSPSIPVLTLIGDHSDPESEPLADWARSVLESYETAGLNARRYRQRHEKLLSTVRDLAGGINLKFLYDPERKLFSIGYNASTGQMDNSFYDLLASEARFGGFVAIARGDVPMEHWFTMGRPHTQIGRQRVLLSWTGTMFEYLMPQIFLHSYRYSLLDKAVNNAVQVQIDFGRKHQIPWGISESAFGDLDFHKTYQYKAFGVPKLGLKRVLDDQLVVSPYSAMMATGVMPGEAVQNLRRLDRLGMLDEYGFYESIDFRRTSVRNGQRGVMVKAYMAHHQGMGLLALTNFLHNNVFQKRFHTDPRARAFEPLLQEKIPTLPPLQLTSSRERTPSMFGASADLPASGSFRTPHTSMPKTQIICNGRYVLMITNTGGGYCKWNGRDITRWRADLTSDRWGTYCYLHDLRKRDVWSGAFHPVGGKVEDYTVEFGLDQAVFRLRRNDIQLETAVTVAPEDDVEIRRMTLINRSGERRRLDLTSYIELSMAEHNADRAHPAFNKLFIQTEALPRERALLAYRRPRSENDEPFFVAHRFVNMQEHKGKWAFETDRNRFIGRGRTHANARGAKGRLSNHDGFVLDPILSLREHVTLENMQRTSLAMVLAVADSREKALELIKKYDNLPAIDRAIDFAWRSSQIELRQLHILPDEARRFQQLADHLVFPNDLLRAPTEILKKNRKGQSGLWPYAISGDFPIILVSIDEARDTGLVRQLLQAQTYLRRHGLMADLVILNEESESYENPLRESLVHLIQAHSMFIGRDQPSGIYMRNAEQMPEDDLCLLKAAASVYMVAARGSLAQQLGTSRSLPQLPEALQATATAFLKTPPLEPLELIHFNGYGGFTPDGREYVIIRKPGMNTPAPWINVMSNRNFGAMVSESGAGFSWYGNSQRNRINGWSNDPVLDPCTEAIYIRDEESGEFWTATGAPVRTRSTYRCRHGAGYTIHEHNHAGIVCELRQFVPIDEAHSPIKIQRLKLKNVSGRRRIFSLTWYTELTLGEHREMTQMHIITHWDEESRLLLAHNCYHPEYGERVTFFAMSPLPQTYCGDRTVFIGRNGALDNPSAMQQTKLADRCGAGLDPCAALQANTELAAGETGEILCLVGQADSIEEARILATRYRDHDMAERSFDSTLGWWDRLLGTISVETPEPVIDILVNRWLLYQSLSCRIWGRSAFYQSGGAFGYRDQLQDVMAFLFTAPDLARQQILLAASRQFREGDVQHWWHPPSGAGIRSRISDDLLWLPYATIRYVKVTGDIGILDEDVPFLEGSGLEPGQHEVFMVPQPTFERGTIFEHCRRAVRKGLTSGPNGLPLIGTGDWNDGMNLVGAKGKGESVWLAWFLVDILDGMAYLADRLGKPELEQDYRQKRNDLVRQIENVAWDGAWYRRGTFDDGSLLGSARSDEARIDSLPQSWAWLTGAGDRQRADRALEAAWEHLILNREQLILLFEPPFDKSAQNPGYIKGYPPGVRENGGQYTHAAIWFAMAMARKGDGDRAVHMLKMMNPLLHSEERKAADHYGLEPFSIPADIYRLPGRVGKGGWSWYTGSAAWMYRAWVEEILGLRISDVELSIHPVVPKNWKGFTVRYRHERSNYTIEVVNPHAVMTGIQRIELDGRILGEKTIRLDAEPGDHSILVVMGDQDA